MPSWNMNFRMSGTPHMVYHVRQIGSDEFKVSRSIDMSRESVFYPNGTGPWTVGTCSAKKVQEMAEQEKWRLHDGRLVSEFPDFREIPKILEEESAREWAELTGSATPQEEFAGAAAVVLVADAFSVFDVGSWDECRGCRQALMWVLNQNIHLDYCRNCGVAETWAEAVKKYGLHIEPINNDDLKALRRQAEDALRKDWSALPSRLSALLCSRRLYPKTITHLRIPRK